MQDERTTTAPAEGSDFVALHQFPDRFTVLPLFKQSRQVGLFFLLLEAKSFTIARTHPWHVSGLPAPADLHFEEVSILHRTDRQRAEATRVVMFQFPEEAVDESMGQHVAQMISCHLAQREVTALCRNVGGNSHILAKLSHLAPTLGPFCQTFAIPTTAPAAWASGSGSSNTTPHQRDLIVCSKLQWLLIDADAKHINQGRRHFPAAFLQSWQGAQSWYEFIRANSRRKEENRFQFRGNSQLSHLQIWQHQIYDSFGTRTAP